MATLAPPEARRRGGHGFLIPPVIPDARHARAGMTGGNRVGSSLAPERDRTKLLHLDRQPHRRVDAAEGLEGAGTGEADGHRLVRLLGAGVEIEALVEDAHVVSARVVVEDGQRAPAAEADVLRREQLVALADDRGVAWHGRPRGWRCIDPSFGRGL